LGQSASPFQAVIIPPCRKHTALSKRITHFIPEKNALNGLLGMAGRAESRNIVESIPPPVTPLLRLD
jgi:hypothetical protein